MKQDSDNSGIRGLCRILAILFLLVLLSGVESCEEIVQPEPTGVTLNTTKAQYEQIELLQYSITNRLSDTIWLSWCSYYQQLQYLQDGEWEDYFDWPWDCLGTFSSISPGQSDTYSVTPFIPFRPGMYRFIKYYSMSRPGRPGLGDPDISILGTTNVFWVKGITLTTKEILNRPRLSISADLQNPVSAPVTYIPCSIEHAYLEELNSGSWSRTTSVNIESCYGDSFVDSYTTISKQFTFDQALAPGTYRLRITCGFPRATLEPGPVYSNEFQIHRE